MSKSKSPRGQFNVRLPKPVLAHLDRTFRDEGWERPLQVLASLVGFECLSKQTRLELVRCATRIGQEEMEWSDLLDVAGKIRVADEKVLRKTLELLVQRVEKKQAVPRQA